MTDLTAVPSDLKVIEIEPDDIAPEACLFLGDDRAGRRFVGHARRTGAALDLATGRLLLELTGALPLSGARRAVEHWRASRIVDAAGVEIGSRVLVIGDGVLAQQVGELCRFAGALRVVACGAGRQGGGGDRADNVICIEVVASNLEAHFAACRDRGTLVLAAPLKEPLDIGFYPNVHKRGLRVRCLAPARSPDAPPLSESAFLRLARLFERDVPRA